jgi:hypothetical protein
MVCADVDIKARALALQQAIENQIFSILPIAKIRLHKRVDPTEA